ncbi:MAG: divergent polysaccharide deacetylase family protein [Candidatus Krumholzibacteriota bacterium]
MNLFSRAFANSRRRRKSGGKSPRKTRGKTAGRRSRSKSSPAGSVAPWLVGAAVVVVVVGIGLLKWSRSGSGQAALLSLGSDKMYADVQTTVESALAGALPNFRPGPVGPAGEAASDRGGDHDWPAPRFGPEAAVRCRVVAVPDDIAWWDLQVQVAAAVESRGARVLWAERLLPGGRLPEDQVRPNELKDLLRLDVGVPGRPTHTLVLHRAGGSPTVRWGNGAGTGAWSRFAAQEGPVVALLIDDWGYSKSEAARTILALPAPVTMAVLPHLPYSRHFALKATDLVLPGDRSGDDSLTGDQPESGRKLRLERGCIVEVGVGRSRRNFSARRREILLHLPMEPQGYPETDPGPRAVMVGMDEEAIGKHIDEAMAALPMITGVNNHMGSAATSDRPTMTALMKALRARDLLFIDSLTSAKSVAFAEARQEGLPTAKNRIFLDYDNENQATIKANLEVLVKSARSAGFALGIGHPHRATAAVLAREIPRLQAQGVRFVTVSEMLALRDMAQKANEGS